MPDGSNPIVLGTSVKLVELDSMADQLLKMGYPGVWCFHGEMGSGKTTLIKSICHKLGVTSAMTSPTFSIVNEYTNHKKEKIYHFDFYRLKKETEAYDIGVEEYFESGQYCFIEWPELIPSLVPQRHVDIWLTDAGQDTRTIAYMKYE
jgi:tRNA threonylcarbamoyladenosine biosynthesis protein TsaE